MRMTGTPSVMKPVRRYARLAAVREMPRSCAACGIETVCRVGSVNSEGARGLAVLEMSVWVAIGCKVTAR